MAGQPMKQARGAMENYLNFFQKSMSAAPWAGTELNKKVADYAQQNVATAFAFAQKLTQAKDLQDVVRIHGELLKLGIAVSQATVGRYMPWRPKVPSPCLLYTSDAADDLTRVDLGGR